VSQSSLDSSLPDGVEVAIKNISGVTAATIIFEARFFDIEGNVLETARRTEVDLKPGGSRALLLQYPRQESSYKLKSYAINIVKMTTADVEKVQLRRHEIKTNPAGESVVEGVVKNISTAKTDVALVANFLNPQKESIGSHVVLIRGMEPESIKRFKMNFKAQPGDTVRTYTLTTGELAENLVQS
jgi:hypothetical protein